MASDIERIKDKLSIEEVVSWYVDIQRVGNQLKARCPFHNEKTPSFYISPDRGTYYCFGCQAKGDVISFVQEYERLDFRGALKLLADKAGITLTHSHEDQSSKDHKQQLYDLIERATLFYEKHLDDSQVDSRVYLKNRGLTDETISKWRVGYAPDAWDSLYVASQKIGTDAALLEQAGLVKASEKHRGKYYDRFRSRIMFPLFDSSGRVIGFSGRIFGEKAQKTGDEAEAKYLNSPETPLFKKSFFLYGLHAAKERMRETKIAVLVEGQFDLIMSHQVGVTNAVATSGTAITSDHVALLRRYVNKLVLAYDGDKAGEAAAIKAAHLAFSVGLDVACAFVPEGKDPADYALKDPAGWKALVEKTEDIIDFTLRVAHRQSDHKEQFKHIESVTLPLIAAMNSVVIQAHYIKRIAASLGVREDMMYDALKQIIQNQQKNKHKHEAVESETQAVKNVLPDTPHSAGVKNTLNVVGKQLLASLVWTKKHHHDFHQKLLSRMTDFFVFVENNLEEHGSIKEISHPTYSILMGYLSDETSIPEDILFESEALFTGSTQVENMCTDILYSMQKDVLKELLSITLLDLKRVEFDGDAAFAQGLLAKVKRITHELHKSKLSV